MSIPLSPTPPNFSDPAGANDKNLNTGKDKFQNPAAGPGNAIKEASDKPPSTDPVILQVLPRITSGNPPTIYLAVYGKNLNYSTIRLNAQPKGTHQIGPDLLEAQPEASDVEGKGTITVDVITNDSPHKVSNCIIVPISKATAALKIGGWDCYITREFQLLLIVLTAGGLGCLIHGVRSIAVFIGNRSAISSWFWWYITRPLLGMSMALIIYSLLRGGFLAGTQADAKVISPFGVLAIGALVGMFTDKAVGKLAEIFDMLFRSKADEANKDTIKKVTIKTSALPVGTVGTPYRFQLEANDGSPSSTWDITGLPAGLAADARTGVINGIPTGPANPTNPVTIIVNSGPGNTDSKTLNLVIQ